MEANTKKTKSSSGNKNLMFQHDPNRQVRGPQGQNLEIPLASLASSRTDQESQQPHGFAVMDGAYDSDGIEETEDVEYLFSDDEQPTKRMSRSSSLETLTVQRV